MACVPHTGKPANGHRRLNNSVQRVLWHCLFSNRSERGLHCFYQCLLGGEGEHCPADDVQDEAAVSTAGKRLTPQLEYQPPPLSQGNPPCCPQTLPNTPQS
jgi:hypothetical protein